MTGWAQEGWRPSGGYYVGGECGQGTLDDVGCRAQGLGLQVSDVGLRPKMSRCEGFKASRVQGFEFCALDFRL